MKIPAAGLMAAGMTLMLLLTTGCIGVAAREARAALDEKVLEPPNRDALATLRGDIVIDGSSTVFPVTAAAAEEFMRYARGVRVTVGISGTGGGFNKFCAGETEIQNASRPIRPTEAEICTANGVEYIELPVAFDALSVVVNPANDWADEMTVEELKTIWEPEAEGRITRWSQVREDWPDRPLVLFGAGTDSGTFDYFTEAVVGEEKASRGDFQASEDDNVLVTGVAGDPNALGFFGYAYVLENEDILKTVGIINHGSEQAVHPSVESVMDGSYQPLSRPLFIYVNSSIAEEPEIAAFIHFYLGPSFTPLIASREVGYVPLGDQIYEAVRERFDQGRTGTLFPKGAEVGASLERYFR